MCRPGGRPRSIRCGRYVVTNLHFPTIVARVRATGSLAPDIFCRLAGLDLLPLFHSPFRPITQVSSADYSRKRPFPQTQKFDSGQLQWGRKEDNMNNGHPIDQLSDSCLRFCWLRETAPGHLEHDGGLRIAKADLLAALLGLHPAQQRTTADPSVSPETALAAVSGAADIASLPTWARRRLAALLGPLAAPEQRAAAAQNAAVLLDVAARIAEAVGSSNDIEVHLPYLDRRNWASRFETLARTRFVRWQGRIIPEALLAGGRMDEYNAQWLAVASVDPAANTEITFAHTQCFPSSLVRVFLPVTTDAKAATAPGSTVEILRTLSSTACRAWYSAPAETTGPYFEVHSEASMAMQSAVRRWFAWHWFSDLSRFENVSDAYTVLAYLVSRPCPGRKRTDFTYDILSEDWTFRAFQFARRPLKQLLNTVFNAIRATGNVKLALKFQPEQARFIIERARTQEKIIRGIIAAEGLVVNHMLKFGLELRNATDAFKVVNLAPDYARGLQSRLRHLFREQDMAYLTTPVMMEATNALWTAMGGEPAITTSVRMSPALQPEVSPEVVFAPVADVSHPELPQC